MPELPEVESIRLGLEKKILGLTINSVQILHPASFQGDPKEIIGKKITKVWRRGKMLGMDLVDSSQTEKRATDSLLFHLKMTGQLLLMQNWQANLDKSTRVVFVLATSYELPATSFLFFNDQRKFGWIKLGNLTSAFGYLISGLGPEPLDENFTWEILRDSLSRHPNLPVKAALMDQSVIAGIGNIYASESLFLAKIDPRRRVKDLTDLEFKALKSSIVKVLSLGIKHGGATRRNFVTIEGVRGGFLDVANVYGRDKESCKICGSKIQKITQSGRSTYFCQKCQD